MKEFLVPQGTKELIDGQFAARKDLIEVYIPKSVERFGAGAFYNCSNLRAVILEQGSMLKHIDDLVFQNGKSLEYINLPDTVETINCHAFWNCSKLPKEMKMPSGLKFVESTAFFNTQIEKVILPSECKYQGEDHGFPYAPSFPELCEVKGGQAHNFYSHFELPMPKIDYDSIKPDDAKSEILSGFGEYVVPPGTKIIKNNQFSERKDLIDIVIPKSVIRIGANAFYFCENLRNVTFEKGSQMPCIEYLVFQNCYNLKNIKLPEGLQQIRGHSFWGCPNLKNIEMPENLKYIDGCAFFMSGIKKVKLPKNCRYHQPGLEHSFPWETAFTDDCKVTGGIADNLYKGRVFPMPSIQDINSIKNPPGLKQTAQTNSNYVVPQGTKKIACNQFFGRQDLIDIVIPKSVEVVGSGAFYLCNNLKTVDFETGSQVKQIAADTFQNCSSLETVRLPEGMQQVRAHAFWACPSLKNINFPESMKMVDCSAFFQSGLEEVTLPDDCKYQGIRHGSPLEKAFPEKCKVNGGISLDLYEANTKKKEAYLAAGNTHRL